MKFVISVWKHFCDIYYVFYYLVWQNIAEYYNLFQKNRITIVLSLALEVPKFVLSLDVTIILSLVGLKYGEIYPNNKQN